MIFFFFHLEFFFKVILFVKLIILQNKKKTGKNNLFYILMNLFEETKKISKERARKRIEKQQEEEIRLKNAKLLEEKANLINYEFKEKLDKINHKKFENWDTKLEVILFKFKFFIFFSSKN